MNLSTSDSKRKTRNHLLVGAVAIIAFFVFDRGISALLEKAETAFYTAGEPSPVPKAPRDYYDTLIMGTSRAREGIMPIYLHRHLSLRALSIAAPGRYPRYHYLAYQQFKKRNGPPRFIFYGIDYFTFDKVSNPAELAALGVNPAANPSAADPPARGIGLISRLARRKPRTDQLLVDLVNHFSMRLEGRKHSDVTPAGISTYTGLNGSVSPEIQQEPSSWHKVDFTPFPGEEGGFLVELLRSALEDRARVFLVYLPDYINVYRTNYRHAEFRAQLEVLASRFPRVYFLDFNRPDRFPLNDPSLFVDGRYGSRICHLSSLGARRFNRMLAHQVQKYLQHSPRTQD